MENKEEESTSQNKTVTSAEVHSLIAASMKEMQTSMMGAMAQLMKKQMEEMYSRYEEEEPETVATMQSPPALPPAAPGKDTASEAPDDTPTSSVLEQLKSRFQREEETGKDISEAMKDVLCNVLERKLPTKELDDLEKTSKRPGNIPSLQPTRVNEVIWSALPSKVKTVDIKLQAVQKSLVKGMTALTYVCDELAGLASEAGEGSKAANILNQAIDSLALLGNTNRELNTKRLELIKPEIRHRGSKQGGVSTGRQQVPSLPAKLQQGELEARTGNVPGRPVTGTRPWNRRSRAFFRQDDTGVSATKQRKTPVGLQQQSVTPDREESPFKAGNLAAHISEWKELTSDPEILDMVTGCHIDFDADQDIVQHKYRSTHVNKSQALTMDSEITKLISKGVIEECEHGEGEWLSTIFLRPKRNGHYRLILNLRDLNEFVQYKHFKMDTLQSVISLMKQGCYMASCDIRDAYYTVPVAIEHRKYLRFIWQDKLYQYTCLPNGLACAPRKFTKLLKPVFSMLRLQGLLIAGYIDDTYLQADTLSQCSVTVDKTIAVLTKLGFSVHCDKSVLKPSQSLIFLGFILNSVTMTVQLTPEKASTIKRMCSDMLTAVTITIQDLAVMIGKLVSSFPGVEYGQLHYRDLERAKQQALKQAKGDYSQTLELSENMRTELKWWVSNIQMAHRRVQLDNPSVEISTDASSTGWGCETGNTRTGGRFTAEEAEHHINYLELLAVLYSLQSCLEKLRNVHVLVKSDNTTAVAYINQMGGSKSYQCDTIARKIWRWAIDRNIWLSATHVPGVSNAAADAESRGFNDTTEWQLNPEVFRSIVAMFSQPCIDLFASRLNAQIENFMSWKPDPLAKHVDAFTVHWGKFKLVYLFPPFSLLARCLQKVHQDQAEAVVVAPYWPTQVWFSLLASMLTERPLLLPKQEALLTLPVSRQLHPLRKRLRMMACRISGKASRETTSQKGPLTSSCRHGGQEHTSNTTCTCANGWHIVTERGIIPFVLL